MTRKNGQWEKNKQDGTESMEHCKGHKKMISFIGFSKSGKTTVISELVRYLVGKGYRVGVIKHTNKNFEMDQEGKDSWRIYRAGADVVVLSPIKMTYQVHLRDRDFDLGLDRDQKSKSDATSMEVLESDPPLKKISQLLLEYDIIITEGFKREFYMGIAVAKNGDELKKLVDLVSESEENVGDKASGESGRRRRIIAAVVMEDTLGIDMKSKALDSETSEPSKKPEKSTAVEFMVHTSKIFKPNQIEELAEYVLSLLSTWGEIKG